MTDDGDRMFIEVALAGRVHAVVTWNVRHYPTGLGFEVLQPAKLLERLATCRAVSIADDLKAAGSDALKKAASLLGVALELYGAGPAEAPPARPPRAASPESPNDRLTSRQLSAIQSIARRRNIGRGHLTSMLEEERRVELPEHTRQLARQDMEQRRVREDAIEALFREGEVQEILVEDLGARVRARHLDEARGAVQPHRLVPERPEVRDVAPRTAAEVEQATRRGLVERLEECGVVLRHVVITRPRPEPLRGGVVVTDRPGRDGLELRRGRTLEARALVLHPPIVDRSPPCRSSTALY